MEAQIRLKLKNVFQD